MISVTPGWLSWFGKTKGRGQEYPRHTNKSAAQAVREKPDLLCDMPHAGGRATSRRQGERSSFSVTSNEIDAMARKVLFPGVRKGKDMAAYSVVRKGWQTLGAIKTGVILLILLVIISAAGTIILQRPVTEADEMQRAYSPQVLRLLDGVGLTDVFHAWWFVLLLSLVSVSIFAASVQRFPNAWRFFSRPYKSTDECFRNALPHHALIPIKDEEAALSV